MNVHVVKILHAGEIDGGVENADKTTWKLFLALFKAPSKWFSEKIMDIATSGHEHPRILST